MTSTNLLRKIHEKIQKKKKNNQEKNTSIVIIDFVMFEDKS